MADTPSPPHVFYRFALVACLCLLAPHAARAQTEVTAGVRGTVKAEGTGLPVAGAT